MHMWLVMHCQKDTCFKSEQDASMASSAPQVMGIGWSWVKYTRCYASCCT